MACERPRRIVNRRYKDMTRRELYSYSRLVFGTIFPPDYWLDVPCGFCHSCKKREMNDYRIRLLYECRKPLRSNSLNLFVTLTFNEKFLLQFADNPNRAVRLFLDRMRKRYGKQVRHWFIGEFGTLNGRPHYHGILFDCPDQIGNSAYGPHPGQNLELESLWKYGFVFVGSVSEQTVGYITKYLTKDLNGERVRPRVISSQGIGDNYLSSDDALLHRSCGYQPFLTSGSFIYALPRYYSNKIFTDVDRQNMAFQRFFDPSISWRWNGKKFDSFASFASARFATLASNRSLGLTADIKPPSRKVRRSIDRFKEILETVKSDYQL